jgi:hypothetical protein
MFARLTKVSLLALAFSGVAFVQAQAEFRDDQIIDNIGDDGIEAVASRLGLRYEELGMGGNQLGRGRYAFNVSVPDAGNEGGPIRADRRKQALTLTYSSSREGFSAIAIQSWNADWSHHVSTAEAVSGTARLTAKLFLADGVTFRTVLEHVRRFHREIGAFENSLGHH